MAYSDKVIDHYNNPRNVGSLPKEDPNVGTGLVGAPDGLQALLHLALHALGPALELLDAPVDAVELLLELEDLLHAGQVHPQLAGQLLDPAQAVDVLLRVEPSVLR